MAHSITMNHTKGLNLFKFLSHILRYMVHACMLSLLVMLQLFATPWIAALPGSSVHGIFQPRRLEWVAYSSSRESSQASDPTRISCISCIGRQVLYHCATWEDIDYLSVIVFFVCCFHHCHCFRFCLF